jgi:hypothetical protein
MREKRVVERERKGGSGEVGRKNIRRGNVECMGIMWKRCIACEEKESTCVCVYRCLFFFWN